MKKHEKIRAYRELCGLTRKEVKTLGDFENSEQFYGQCEAGKYDIGTEVEKKMYDAINRARAKKMQLAKENEG